VTTAEHAVQDSFVAIHQVHEAAALAAEQVGRGHPDAVKD